MSRLTALTVWIIFIVCSHTPTFKWMQARERKSLCRVYSNFFVKSYMTVRHSVRLVLFYIKRLDKGRMFTPETLFYYYYCYYSIRKQSQIFVGYIIPMRDHRLPKKKKRYFMVIYKLSNVHQDAKRSASKTH